MTSKRATSAFTLVELITTLTLSTFLMIGLLTVITVVSNHEWSAEQTSNDDRQMLPESVSVAFAELLRHDLLHAQSIDIENNHINIEGFGALNPHTYAPTHRPAQVEYLLQEHGDSTAIVRLERVADDLTSDNTIRQLVMTDIAEFTLEKTTPASASSTVESTYHLIVVTKASDKLLIDRWIMIGGAS